MVPGIRTIVDMDSANSSTFATAVEETQLDEPASRSDDRPAKAACMKGYENGGKCGWEKILGPPCMKPCIPGYSHMHTHMCTHTCAHTRAHTHTHQIWATVRRCTSTRAANLAHSSMQTKSSPPSPLSLGPSHISENTKDVLQLLLDLCSNTGGDVEKATDCFRLERRGEGRRGEGGCTGLLLGGMGVFAPLGELVPPLDFLES